MDIAALSASFDMSTMAVQAITGTVGFVAVTYGHKKRLWRPVAIGVALMAYPYLVPGLWQECVIGIVLLALLYYWRE